MPLLPKSDEKAVEKVFFLNLKFVETRFCHKKLMLGYKSEKKNLLVCTLHFHGLKRDF
jgi:hypothetical protein